MSLTAYRLTFSAPFHVDGRGTGYYQQAEHFIRSDTLSAALTACWAQLDPQAVAAWGGEPPFRVSSAFPWFGATLYLPRPVHTRALHLSPDRLDLAKAVKKVQWIDAGIWSGIARDPGRLVDDRCTEIRGPLALKPENARQLPHDFVLWQEEERPRLALDRSDNRALKGLLFHFSRIHYHPEGGLWFVASFADPSVRRPFEAALGWLGDSGIGADRSNGNGFFKAGALSKVPLREAKDSKPAVSLSLVNPSERDRSTGFLEGAAYDLIRRGGWIGGSARRKPALRMFIEGSRFRSPLCGRVVELCRHPKYGHPIWRDGRGLFAAI